MEIDYSLKNQAHANATSKSFRCPHCLQIGVFTNVQQSDYGNANFFSDRKNVLILNVRDMSLQSLTISPKL
jgi:hypothetical protein